MMKIETIKLPKLGDYIAFRTEIWSQDNKKFSFTAKISSTEIAISLNNGSAKSESDIEKQLKDFSVKKAMKIFNTGKYNDGDSFKSWFSPSWPDKLKK